MVAICFYFQVHQPKRLRKYTYFDVGCNHYYEDDVANREIFLKVANKCYLPATALFLNLINKYPGVFKISFSITGVFIEQCKRYSPETLDAFKRLAATGQVEFINETYYHSLSFLFSQEEFKAQVAKHRQLIKDEFDYDATTFRNTELIYNDELAKVVSSLGYKTILAEGTEKILGWRSPNYVYQPLDCPNLKLLLRNYSLTDDIGFRFSEKSWSEYPVCADKYACWLHALHGQADLINLFMDFETFGEHQWEDTGIFEFLYSLPEYVLRHPEYNFMTPAEASQKLQPVASLSVPSFMSWADVDRDLTAWRGNDLQEDALQSIYAMSSDIYALNDPGLLEVWRSLLTSDHFYYMCTKYSADGDVHKYFNPYSNPYEAYINYQNIVSDLTLELKRRKERLSEISKPKGFLADIWELIGRKIGVVY
ncbi:MAG: glycoside hydrolase family 57 protein, partial [Gammaproteobacteria bacterium]|nr:glycoside hydrolase family 57 protein [Gammaproteobacteria bacterium]